MPETEPVLCEIDDGTATLTLNRPEVLNAMNDELMGGICRAMERVVEDESVRVVIVTGAGRGFCAGADLASAAEGPTDPSTEEGGGGSLFNAAVGALMDSPVPTVARINGPAAGGGLGLALSCDIAIAAESAIFVATFGPNLGIVPDLGSTWSIPLRIGRARALGMMLLGDRISANQAEAWGLIWRSVPDDDLDEEVGRVADVLKRSSPSACTRIRDCADAAIHHTFTDQLGLEMAHQGVLIPRNMQQGARAFMEKRTPVFGGERG
ncbi:MAG: enoyl-CoA hydratase [Pseudomonadales bacterium]|nr:enoyl-CoA hydratase [Pseudomonadales bacterium]NIX08141.1 enoyl-CoA hydratase [Pseudomonadales bacterium]